MAALVAGSAIATGTVQAASRAKPCAYADVKSTPPVLQNADRALLHAQTMPTGHFSHAAALVDGYSVTRDTGADDRAGLALLHE